VTEHELTLLPHLWPAPDVEAPARIEARLQARFKRVLEQPGCSNNCRNDFDELEFVYLNHDADRARWNGYQYGRDCGYSDVIWIATRKMPDGRFAALFIYEDSK